MYNNARRFTGHTYLLCRTEHNAFGCVLPILKGHSRHRVTLRKTPTPFRLQSRPASSSSTNSTTPGVYDSALALLVDPRPQNEDALPSNTGVVTASPASEPTHEPSPADHKPVPFSVNSTNTLPHTVYRSIELIRPKEQNDSGVTILEDPQPLPPARLTERPLSILTLNSNASLVSSATETLETKALETGLTADSGDVDSTYHLDPLSTLDRPIELLGQREQDDSSVTVPEDPQLPQPGYIKPEVVSATTVDNSGSNGEAVDGSGDVDKRHHSTYRSIKLDRPADEKGPEARPAEDTGDVGSTHRVNTRTTSIELVGSTEGDGSSVIGPEDHQSALPAQRRRSAKRRDPVLSKAKPTLPSSPPASSVGDNTVTATTTVEENVLKSEALDASRVKQSRRSRRPKRKAALDVAENGVPNVSEPLSITRPTVNSEGNASTDAMLKRAEETEVVTLGSEGKPPPDTTHVKLAGASTERELLRVKAPALAENQGAEAGGSTRENPSLVTDSSVLTVGWSDSVPIAARPLLCTNLNTHYHRALSGCDSLDQFEAVVDRALRDPSGAKQLQWPYVAFQRALRRVAFSRYLQIYEVAEKVIGRLTTAGVVVDDYSIILTLKYAALSGNADAMRRWLSICHHRKIKLDWIQFESVCAKMLDSRYWRKEDVHQVMFGQSMATDSAESAGDEVCLNSFLDPGHPRMMRSWLSLLRVSSATPKEFLSELSRYTGPAYLKKKLARSVIAGLAVCGFRSFAYLNMEEHGLQVHDMPRDFQKRHEERHRRLADQRETPPANAEEKELVRRTSVGRRRPDIRRSIPSSFGDRTHQPSSAEQAEPATTNATTKANRKAVGATDNLGAFRGLPMEGSNNATSHKILARRETLAAATRVHLLGADEGVGAFRGLPMEGWIDAPSNETLAETRENLAPEKDRASTIRVQPIADDGPAPTLSFRRPPTLSFGGSGRQRRIRISRVPSPLVIRSIGGSLKRSSESRAEAARTTPNERVRARMPLIREFYSHRITRSPFKHLFKTRP